MGRAEPIFQERTWKQDEETMTITGRQIADVQSEYAERIGSRRVYAERRICIRRNDQSLLSNQTR